MKIKEIYTLSYPVKLRHYTTNKEIVRENSRDFSIEASLNIATAKSFLLEDLSPRFRKPSMCSSVHGPIAAILLALPRYAVIAPEQNPYWKIISDLIVKLPEYTRFVILLHQSAVQDFNYWIKQNALNEEKFLIREIPDHVPFSIWAEDPYAVINDGKEKFIVEPLAFRRPSDSIIADYASEFLGFPLHEIPVHYEGGNFLVADDFIFMGADYPNYTLRYEGRLIQKASDESPRDTVVHLYHEHLDSQRELIFIGSKESVPSEKWMDSKINGEDWKEKQYGGNPEGTVQPMFHIDMFMTLAGRHSDGRYQVVLGDPRMAAELLGVPVPENSIPEAFDNIEKQLLEKDFIVIRNPLPAVYMDDPEKKERSWYFATSNNCLSEIYGDVKRVYLPTYGHGSWKELEKTDASNREIWESLGFEVVSLCDYHPLAENLGAVHCIKKYLSRELN